MGATMKDHSRQGEEYGRHRSSLRGGLRDPEDLCGSALHLQGQLLWFDCHILWMFLGRKKYGSQNRKNDRFVQDIPALDKRVLWGTVLPILKHTCHILSKQTVSYNQCVYNVCPKNKVNKLKNMFSIRWSYWGSLRAGLRFPHLARGWFMGIQRILYTVYIYIYIYTQYIHILCKSILNGKKHSHFQFQHVRSFFG